MATRSQKLAVQLSTNSSCITVSRKPAGYMEQNLTISFQRTVRVSDNADVNKLPPGLGAFPLHQVDDYKDTLPETMLSKFGYFLPMYQREAMWIQFHSSTPFAVKVHIGGVNAVSGEPLVETPETMMRRLKLLEEDRNLQDYIVSPAQQWLDGIANTDGTVRQFVAMPLGSGYSVEAQLTGMDLVGGIQIEVIPSKLQRKIQLTPRSKKISIQPVYTPPRRVIPKPSGTEHFRTFVKLFAGKTIALDLSHLHSVLEVKEMIEAREGIPRHEQRLIFRGCQMADNRSLGDYPIPRLPKLKKESTFHLMIRLRGGGSSSAYQMGVAAGGLIKQTIVKDRHDPSTWDVDRSTTFNIQILNSSAFEKVTGKAPPTTPVTAQAYAAHGFPYFDIFDEKPSGIKGDFHGVKSVNEKDMEGKATWEKVNAVAEVVGSTKNPVVLLGEDGKRAEFRPVRMMEKEVREMFGGMSV